jgi:hypothetical protein
MSEVLTNSKKFYSKMEKVCYIVIMSAQKLQHYFKAHTIKVLNNLLLSYIFSNRDNSIRMSKLAIELSEHVVDFKKHSAIKSQFLDDFVVEWMQLVSATEGVVNESSWLVYYDRA